MKRYDTAIPPPKKDAKPKGMSPSVRAFLEKKEQEAKKKNGKISAKQGTPHVNVTKTDVASESVKAYLEKKEQQAKNKGEKMISILL